MAEDQEQSHDKEDKEQESFADLMARHEKAMSAIKNPNQSTPETNPEDYKLPDTSGAPMSTEPEQPPYMMAPTNSPQALLDTVRARAGVNPEMQTPDLPPTAPGSATGLGALAPAPEPEDKAPKESPDRNPQAVTMSKLEEAEKSQPQQPIPPDYLQQLKDVQTEQQKLLARAQMSRGAAQALAGGTRQKADYSQAEAYEKQANLPVENLKQQIGITQIQSQLNDQRQMTDPTSETSKMLRDFSAKMGFPLSENVSGAHIQQVAPYMVKAFAAQTAKDRALQVAAMKGNGDKKAQDSAYQKALTQLNTSRLPPDVKQAKVDEYLASKANLIFDKYPNLNNISEAQKNQLIAELGKIAQGGVPTAAELKGIDPDTFAQRVNHLIGQVSNVPQGANVGAFLQQQKDYLKDLSQNARDRINNYHESVVSEYEPVMGSEHANTLRQLRQKEQDQSDSASNVVHIRTSDGQDLHIPKKNLDKARIKDPGLQIMK